MNATEKDATRRFQRDRVRASYRGNEKAVAQRLGITRQALAARKAISYADLGRLAEDPNANPEAIPLGALELIESVRVGRCDLLELADRANEWLAKAQVPDGEEDCAQYDLAGVLASIGLMHDYPTLPFRKAAVATLKAWQEAKRREMACDMAALSYVGALIARLEPVEGAR